MKTFYFIWLLLLGAHAKAFTIEVVFKNNLAFTADSLASLERQSEQFDLNPRDRHLEDEILAVARKTVALLPAQYLPRSLQISVERTALFTQAGRSSEQVPLSMIFTSQIPQRNEIRFSDYEMLGRRESTRTIVAHEVGHMLIEWACRASGVTQPTDSSVQSSHWSGSVYEGVADYITATVNQTTVIGSPGAWYSRDILKFKTLEDARRKSRSTIQLVELGWSRSGLLSKYQIYRDTLAEFKRHASADTNGDAYVEAPWLAGRLWQLSKSYGSQRVFSVILELAISGKKMYGPDQFLQEVKSKLE